MHAINTSRPAMRRTASLCGVVGVCAVTLVACHGTSTPSGGGTTAPAGAAQSPTVAKSGSSRGDTVAVKDFSFAPQTLTVSMGATVTWRFQDAAAHTVDIDSGKIMSKPLQNNATYTHVFNQPGTYNYICSIHPYMHGSITVK